VSDWQTQVDELLTDYEGITRERYAAGLASFRAWYAQNYPNDPDASLLTDDEVRDYRVHLTTVKGYTATTRRVPKHALARAPRPQALACARQMPPHRGRCNTQTQRRFTLRAAGGRENIESLFDAGIISWPLEAAEGQQKGP
jgi:hypothetical protein